MNIWIYDIGCYRCLVKNIIGKVFVVFFVYVWGNYWNCFNNFIDRCIIKFRVYFKCILGDVCWFVVYYNCKCWLYIYFWFIFNILNEVDYCYYVGYDSFKRILILW